MTQVGHTLMGLSFAVVALPVRWRWPSLAAAAVAFAILGNVPDIAVPGWGHDQYLVSHSLFVNLVLIVPLAALFAGVKRTRVLLGGTTVIALGGAAWLSHLLLDCFYGGGLVMFWPVFPWRLDLSLPWFSVLPPEQRWTLAAFRVWGIEALCFGGLLAACASGRLATWRLRRRGWGPR
jgi:hypothetical protein